MTVEIRQLVIRAVAEPRRAEPSAAPEPGPQPQAAVDRQALVAECVREVLRTLERRRER